MFATSNPSDPDEPLVRCARCGVSKPPDMFNWRHREQEQRDTYCRPCRADYKHEHYARNRQRYIDQAAVRDRALAEERLAYLLTYFESHPCSDCGETDPLVLEFDHQGDKLFDIGSALRHRSWGSILAEIRICEVVCANCHRRRHHRQNRSVRFLLANLNRRPT